MHCKFLDHSLIPLRRPWLGSIAHDRKHRTDKTVQYECHTPDARWTCLLRETENAYFAAHLIGLPVASQIPISLILPLPNWKLSTSGPVP
jgi:hypothetical protein